jgi:hypothetical protein
MSGRQSTPDALMIKLQQELAHLENKYGLKVFFNSRTTIISMHWWEEGTKTVSELTQQEWEKLFPAALQMTIQPNTTTTAAAASSSSSSSNNNNNTIIVSSIRPYEDHACPDLAAAAGRTVFHFCAELLAEVFRACCSIYKRCGRAAQRQHALEKTKPSWILAKVNQTATKERQDKQLREEMAKWNSLTAEQQAALLLFTSPPVRKHSGESGRDACIRLYSPKEYK